MAAPEIAPLCEMPLDEEFKGFCCRTGNYMLFHFFHFRHRLPGSAARIISQNFASCRLACSFKAILFFVFKPLTSFTLNWPGLEWAAAFFKIPRLL
jgi:hypothetical protein